MWGSRPFGSRIDFAGSRSCVFPPADPADSSRENRPFLRKTTRFSPSVPAEKPPGNAHFSGKRVENADRRIFLPKVFPRLVSPFFHRISHNLWKIVGAMEGVITSSITSKSGPYSRISLIRSLISISSSEFDLISLSMLSIEAMIVVWSRSKMRAMSVSERSVSLRIR